MVAAGVTLFALCAAFAAAPTLAARAHASSSFAFGGPGAVAGEAGSLSLASGVTGSGIAVDDASRDVYVADTGYRRIDQFTAAGVFVRAWGWGVATGAAELQVCTSSCQPGIAGSQPGEFQSPSYVAVDNGATSASKGAVYVADPADDLVTKFDADGHLAASWGDNGENASHEHTEPNGQLNGSPSELFTSGFTVSQIPILGITVDGSGDLSVYNDHERLFEFKQDGGWMQTSDARLAANGGAGGIAVSSACEESCELYVHDAFGAIQAFDPASVNVGRITTGGITRGEEAQGVAIDASDGDRYVVREGSLVEDIPGSCAPSENGCAPSQVFGEGALEGASGVALDPGSGAAFVANADADRIVVFALALEGDIDAASNVLAHEAVLHATVDPVGAELSSCRFEFGRTLAYGSSVPCAQSVGSIGNGPSLVPVDAAAGGLSGGTTYHFRLHARSPSGNLYSEDATFTSSTTAVVREVSATEVSAGTALLQAVVNPEGLPAHYHFEYAVCAGAGQCAGSPFTASVPQPDREIPAGTSDVTVSQPVHALSAGATYHFRIAVVDADGQALPTPEGTFVHEPPAPGCASERPPVDDLLGDCRAYEMVTPPDKNGALINRGVFIESPSVAADGSRVLSMTIQCFDGPESCTAIRQTEGTPYAFTRTEAGWQTEPLAPPISANSTMLLYSADSDVALFARSAQPPALEELFAREPDGTLRAIGPIGETPGAHIGSITGLLRVASGDLSRVVYQGQNGLWPKMEAGSRGAQEVFAYPGDAPGQPQLVGVSGGAGSTSLIGACGTLLGGDKEPRSTYGSLSADGRATFFTVKPCSTGTVADAGVEVPAFTLYQRVEVASGAIKTVLVSGPGPASVCDAGCRKAPPRDALFEGASADGSRVFFTDTGQLTSDATDDKQSHDSAFSSGCSNTSSIAPGCNLYELACPAHCEDESERTLADVSAGDNSGVGAQVQGVMAIPPDGSDVYFIAHGALTSGANGMGREPVPGAANLYIYQFGAGGGEGQVKFIATLSQADRSQWSAGVGLANVSSDGRFLVFTSHNALTGDVSREEGPAQVYRYDAATEHLVRVSIGQAGFGDDGNAGTADAHIVEANHGFFSGVGPGRSDPTMSENGQLVFFETPAGLTPGALNDHPVVGNPKLLTENVYEWEAEGAQPSPSAPACAESNGCVSLIADGRDLAEGADSHENHGLVPLLGVDASGQNVFFWSADELVAQDTDSQVDLYDARIGGGFAPPSVSQPCATLEECRPTPPAEPLFSSPPSATFSGGGDLMAPAPGAGQSVKPKSPTRAQQLARALRACRKIKSRLRRASCEARAHKRYGAKRRPKATTRKSSSS